MPLVLLLIIIFIVPEDSLEYMLGAILGGGYGILMVIAFVAILYGIYKFFPIFGTEDRMENII